MTLVSFDTRISRGAARPSAPADGLRPLRAALANFMEWRRRRQEQKALEAIPFDIRKDLGWPSSDSLGTRRR